MKKLNCILLVDDNPGDIYLHSFYLKYSGLGCTVKSAYDGKEALAYLSNSLINVEYPVPDLILLDINMPGMDGFSFISHFSKLDEQLKKSVIIIMVTSSTDPNELFRAMNTGYVKDYVNKPLEYDSMIELLQKNFDITPRAAM